MVFPDYENVREKNDAGNEKVSHVLKELLRNRTLVILYTSVAVFMVFSQAVSFWGATFLIRMLDFNLAQASFFMGSQALLALIAAPLGGMIADRISRNNPSNKVRLCFASTLLTILFFCAGTIQANLLFLYIGAFFSTFFLAAQMASTQEIVPSHQRASSYGVYVMSQYLLGGLWGPLLVGYLSDTVSFKFAFLTVTCIGTIGSMGYLIAGIFFNADVEAARKKEIVHST